MKYMVAYDGSNCSRLALERTLGLLREKDTLVIASFVEKFTDIGEKLST